MFPFSTYTISIESRVTGTGPINSTVSAMDLELVFNGDCFGKLSLPEFKTNFWGATVSILDQKIDILDMAAHKAFVRSVIVDDETSFLLENGTCTIKAVGITAHCDYCLEVPLRGMMGPKFTLTRMNRIGETLTAEFQAENPSPVEIDHGASTFEIRNDKNETVAEMKGNLKIKRGSFKFRLRGTAKQGVAPSGKSRLVGIGVEDNSWCNETIQNIDVNFEIDSESLLLLSKQ